MSIAQRLLIIVLLTVAEVSVTVWAALGIAKGATYHQLNSLHLKYNAQFSDQLADMPPNGGLALDALRTTINLIREQPIACIEKAGALDRVIMRLIDTIRALELCEKDIADADAALAAIDRYEAGTLPQAELESALRFARDEFIANSSAFEEPVTNTVQFTLRTLIPLILFISLFNIALITYLSRTISGSIARAIGLLKSDSHRERSAGELGSRLSTELRELLRVAEARLEQDLLNINTNERLRALIHSKTAALQDANDELEQFAYRSSHDLKAPLTRTRRLIKFILDDLKRGETQEAQENLRAIDDQMASLEALVEDLISLAKTDLVDSPSDRFAVSELLDEIAEELTPLADESGVRMTASVPPADQITTQRIRLAQVLNNLLSNSYKYADASKTDRWVHVDVAERDRDWQIVVEDNGLGVPAEHQPKLFTRFKRFHPTVGTGSGLGLAIVKRHVDRMHGEIRYEAPAKESGARFVLNLPKALQG
ncbi:MAG: HAMP domain-containing sensor histidine kinase [Pseudomonadota bacterium]